MIEFKGETLGLEDFREDIVQETLRDLVAPAEEAGRGVRDLIKRLLSGRSPSQPGEPPGRDKGDLYRSIGSTEAYVDRRKLSVTVSVGVGAGAEALREIEKSKAKGENVFEHAWNQEHGGVRAGGVPEPRRPFVGPGFSRGEAEALRIIREALT